MCISIWVGHVTWPKSLSIMNIMNISKCECLVECLQPWLTLRNLISLVQVRQTFLRPTFSRSATDLELTEDASSTDMTTWHEKRSRSAKHGTKAEHIGSNTSLLLNGDNDVNKIIQICCKYPSEQVKAVRRKSVVLFRMSCDVGGKPDAVSREMVL